jgi:ABC-2 type transport system permease protein
MLQKQIKLLPVLIKTYWQRHIVYRLGALIWIINGFVTPLVLMGIWLTIRKHNNLPLTENQIITYYLLTTLVVRITQSWVDLDLSYLIKEGEISNFLIKPLYYWIPELAKDISLKTIRLISLIPFLFIIWIAFKDQINLHLNLINIILFILSSILGYFINFIMQNIVGLCTFWLKHYQGLSTLYSLVKSLLSGVAIPISLMPGYLAVISKYSPFRYIISFPIEIIMNTISTTQILFGFSG